MTVWISDQLDCEMTRMNYSDVGIIGMAKEGYEMLHIPKRELSNASGRLISEEG